MLTDSHEDSVRGEREIKVVSDIGAGQAGNLKTKHSERTYVLSAGANRRLTIDKTSYHLTGCIFILYLILRHKYVNNHTTYVYIGKQKLHAKTEVTAAHHPCMTNEPLLIPFIRILKYIS